MSTLAEREALNKSETALATLLAGTSNDLRVRTLPDVPQADLVASTGKLTFLVEWKGSGSAASVAGAIDQLRKYVDRSSEPVIPLVAVTYMGPVGRDLCQRAGMGWFDLSGNARIDAPGIRIQIQGQPNLYKSRGRPANVFAPKSSRIARWLLIHTDTALTQRELARATGVDEGFTSRIIKKLERDGLVVRNGAGTVLPRDPDLLLDAWRETYVFSKHQITRGHIVARSGEALLEDLANRLHQLGVEHAATGLGAAWLLTRFAAFRTATFYLRERPDTETLSEISFRDDSRGANVWLVVPNDDGVFHGAETHHGIRCVHPIQVYLDLEGHPERAGESAARLRTELLRWPRR